MHNMCKILDNTINNAQWNRQAANGKMMIMFEMEKKA